MLRGAVTLSLDDETKEKYGESKVSARDTSKILTSLAAVALFVFSAGFLLQGDTFAQIASLILLMYFLPSFFAHFIKLNRLEKESANESADSTLKQ